MTSNVNSVLLFLEIDVHTKYVFYYFIYFMWSNFIRFMMLSQFSPLSVSKPDGTEQIIQKNEPSFVPLFLPEQEHALQRHSVSPAWRLDREMIGEETINSTRSMIYSLKVFYFLLYRSRYTFICF